jgi:hypothetical protein
MILIIVSLYSFLGNSALLGPSVYIGIYSKEFSVNPSTASGLISYPNLAFGFGKSPSPLLRGFFKIAHSYRITVACSFIPKNRQTACNAVFISLCEYDFMGLWLLLTKRVSCGTDRIISSEHFHWVDDSSCLPCFWVWSLRGLTSTAGQ